MTTMTNLKLPLLALALAGSLASLSCGGGGSDAANAYVTSTLGSGNTGHCNIMEPADTLFVVLGRRARPVADGEQLRRKPRERRLPGHRRRCTDTFDVNVQVTQGTINGFTPSGTLTSSPAAADQVQRELRVEREELRFDDVHRSRSSGAIRRRIRPSRQAACGATLSLPDDHERREQRHVRRPGHVLLPELQRLKLGRQEGLPPICSSSAFTSSADSNSGPTSRKAWKKRRAAASSPRA